MRLLVVNLTTNVEIPSTIERTVDSSAALSQILAHSSCRIRLIRVMSISTC